MTSMEEMVEDGSSGEGIFPPTKIGKKNIRNELVYKQWGIQRKKEDVIASCSCVCSFFGGLAQRMKEVVLTLC